MKKKILIDSHLDLAWNAISWSRNLRDSLDDINRREVGMTDQKGRACATTCFPEMRRGRMAACLGTMMARVPYGETQLHGTSLDYPCHPSAYGFAVGQLGYYEALDQVGEIRLLKTKQQWDQHITEWETADDDDELPIGMIIAMEGCDAIMSPSQAEHWFEKGLRCTSLVHYGKSAYAEGTGEEGPLTAAGREMLAEFERVGMILDLTHLSDAGFFEAVELFNGPVVASHQNCRALVPGQRQFSDEQIRIVIERGGVLGAAMDSWMLYPGGWIRGETDRSVVSLDAVADHIVHICDLAGNTLHSAIGSDLDGGYGTEQTPVGLDSIADLQKLDAILRDRGFSEEDVENVFFRNWARFFSKHLPAG